MSNAMQMSGEREYNSSMYLARLFFKHTAVKVCAVLLCLYAVSVLPFCVFIFLAEAQFVSAILLISGLALTAVGLVLAISTSKEGGAMYDTSFVLIILGAAALICEKGWALIKSVSIENVLHIIFLIVFIALMLSVKSASKGNDPKFFWGYLYAFAGIAAAAFSVFMLITCIGFFQSCYKSTYDWDFLAETVGTDSAKNIENYNYMFFGANVASKWTKAILFTRTAERVCCIIAIFLSSAIMLRLIPYLSEQKKRVDFASEAGGFEFFDEDDSFRSISKKQRTQNSDGFGAKIEENDGFDDFPDEMQDDFGNEQPYNPNEKPGANEFGDYFDEKDGIYYYFDAETGKYYYVDEATGECRYKNERKRPRPPRQPKPQPSVTGETMPWEEEQDEEDNIYNY